MKKFYLGLLFLVPSLVLSACSFNNGDNKPADETPSGEQSGDQQPSGDGDQQPVNKYTVTYKAGNGTGSDYLDQNIDEGTSRALVTFAATGFTAPEGYRFAAWSVDGTQKQPGETIVVNANKTVTAVYEQIPVPKHSVTYQPGEGSGENHIVANIDEGSQHTLIAFADSGFTAPSGYRFAAWHVGEVNKQPGEKIVVDADKTVVAVYESTDPRLMASVNYPHLLEQKENGFTYTTVDAYSEFGPGGTNYGGIVTTKANVSGSQYEYEIALDTQYLFASAANAIGIYGGQSSFNKIALLVVGNGYIDLFGSYSYQDGEDWIEVGPTAQTWGGKGKLIPDVCKTNGVVDRYISAKVVFNSGNFKFYLNGTEVYDINAKIFNTAAPGIIANYVGAGFSFDVHAVTYDAGEGTGEKVVGNVFDGHEYTLLSFADAGLTAPAGKRFIGWSVGGETKQPGEKIVVDADKTVVAVYEAIPQYSITYKAGEGTGEDHVVADVYEGTEHTLLTLEAAGITAPAGKEFAGWQIDSAVKQAGEAITVTGNVEAVAQFSSAKYTITYTAGEGSGDDHVIENVIGGSQHTLIAFADSGFTAPSGYRFLAWSVGGVQKAPGEEIDMDGNKTITAVYEAIPQYSVTYKAGNGSGDDHVVEGIYEGTEYTLIAFADSGLTAPTGYSFKEWKVGGVAKQPGATIAMDANKTIVAVYSSDAPHTMAAVNYSHLLDQTSNPGTCVTLPNGSSQPDNGQNYGGVVYTWANYTGSSFYYKCVLDTQYLNDMSANALGIYGGIAGNNDAKRFGLLVAGNGYIDLFCCCTYKKGSDWVTRGSDSAPTWGGWGKLIPDNCKTNGVLDRYIEISVEYNSGVYNFYLNGESPYGPIEVQDEVLRGDQVKPGIIANYVGAGFSEFELVI